MSIIFEGDGATVFQHACQLGLEGIVSKRRDLHIEPEEQQEV